MRTHQPSLVRFSAITGAPFFFSPHQTSAVRNFAPFARTRDPAIQLKKAPVIKTPSANASRLEGVITSWRFIERCGEIEVEQQPEKQVYKICNAQSFETIMPTQHRSLVGTKVKFVPLIEPDPADDSQLVRSAVHITMDLASTPVGKRCLADSSPTGQNVALLSEKEIAKRIQQNTTTQNPPTHGIMDLRAETLFGPGGFLSQGSGPSYKGPKQVAGALSKAEQRDLGDGMTLQGNLVRVEAPAEFALLGEVVAWSGITRTGLIRIPGEKEEDGRDVQYAISNVEAFVSAMPSSIALRGATVRFRPVHLHSVDNAEEVVSAAGKAKLKLGKVLLSVAERIEVIQLQQSQKKPAPLPNFGDDDVNPTANQNRQVANDTTASAQSDAQVLAASVPDAPKKSKPNRFRMWMAEEIDGETEAPEGLQYGVITRWSGGQGVIESATGKTFMIESAANFSTYFEVGSVSVRGAVVEFIVIKDKPKFAANIRILSDMAAAAESGSVTGTSVPLANLPFDLAVDPSSASAPAAPAAPSPAETASVPESTAQNAATATTTTTVVEGAAMDGDKEKSNNSTVASRPRAPNAIDVSALPVRSGVLVSYSPAEFQGVLKDQNTGERFLLRDVRHDIQNFELIKSKVARGCVLNFRAVGSSGRLATFGELTLLPDGQPFLVDQAALDESENQQSAQKPVEEAVAGPMSMNYWIARFEKVGANMSELKKLQQTAFVPGEMPKDDKGNNIVESIEEARKKDPWFNDPEKNRKIPGTKLRFSDMMQMNHTGMIEMSNEFKDPQKLMKKKVDLEAQLPPEVREQGMRKAKDFGPKYLKAIKEAQQRGQGASNFHFSG